MQVLLGNSCEKSGWSEYVDWRIHEGLVVPIDNKIVVDSRLIADGTVPSWLTLVHLQIQWSIKALQMRACRWSAGGKKVDIKRKNYILLASSNKFVSNSYFQVILSTNSEPLVLDCYYLHGVAIRIFPRGQTKETFNIVVAISQSASSFNFSLTTMDYKNEKNIQNL